MALFELNFLDKTVPDAYHGTELSRARQIVSSNRFIPRGELDSFLGFGVYFFEGSMDLAEWWARTRHGTAKQYGILKATVQLGRCLDLTARENRDKIRFWKRKVEKRLKGRKVTDTAVINSFASECEGGFDSVRSVFVPESPEPIYEGSRIFDFRLVICVRNMGNISDISFVLSGLI